jgi:hypothetical protein
MSAIGACGPCGNRFTWRLRWFHVGAFQGIFLLPDGRLTVEIEESDGHYRQRRYTLWSELDGTIREMPAPPDAAGQADHQPDIADRLDRTRSRASFARRL